MGTVKCMPPSHILGQVHRHPKMRADCLLLDTSKTQLCWQKA